MVSPSEVEFQGKPHTTELWKTVCIVVAAWKLRHHYFMRLHSGVSCLQPKNTNMHFNMNLWRGPAATNCHFDYFYNWRIFDDTFVLDLFELFKCSVSVLVEQQ